MVRLNPDPTNRQQASPWRTIIDWLLDERDQTPPDWAIKALHPRTALCLFTRIPKVTLYLNRRFNHRGLYDLDAAELYRFLKKEIVRPLGLQRWDFMYLKADAADRQNTDLHRKLPHLKPYEVQTLLNAAAVDTDGEAFRESLGLLNHRVKKLTRKMKAEISRPAEPDDEPGGRTEAGQSDIQTEKKKIVTFAEWKAHFRTENKL